MDYPRDSKLVAAFLAIGFGMIMFVILTFWGMPTNSLHSAAQGWMGSLIFGGVAAIVGANVILEGKVTGNK